MATFAWYCVLAGPTFYWLDSSELVAATWGLGISHPPGHPLALLWGRLWCYLPFGSIAFRVTLASAGAAALASYAVTALAAEVLNLGAKALGRTLRELSALSAGLCFGLSFPVTLQAVRAEVYALNGASLALCLLFVLRWWQQRDWRQLLLAAFVGGLSLCNHHLLALLAAVPAIAFIAWRWGSWPQDPEAGRRIARPLLLVVACGLCGLAPLALLPVRSAQAPRVNWGAPHTLQRFGWVVSAKAFQKGSAERAGAQPLAERVLGATFAVFGGLSPLGALLALAGLYLLLRRKASRPTGLLLLGVASFNLLGPILVGFDPFNPDALGYLVVALVALAPALALPIAWISESLALRWQPARYPLALASLALPLVLAFNTAQAADLRDHWAAEESAQGLLDQPPGALLATSYFESIFNIWALQETADLRPDLAVFHRNFVAQPGYVENLLRRQPQLADFWQAWRRSGTLPLGALDRLAASRAVRIEYDLNIRPALGAKLFAEGPLLAYRPVGKNTPADEHAHRARIDAWLEAAGDPAENETRRALTWSQFLLADWACKYATASLAHFHLSRALKLAPRSKQLLKLARRCLADPSQGAPAGGIRSD